ncbi:mucin-5AC-like [Dreissena polymorpha]|uniref:Uncharacterized protein n=1 Tax=Dreissena polymorpha TaxID=45954 RepID=A0A9D4KV87_DREPO|nr:mucin-5AC-like [Dreissena polymorpha]KAH3846758.1 hypothetical protein DPMN_089063 [Dreissena polymorpha]
MSTAGNVIPLDSTPDEDFALNTTTNMPIDEITNTTDTTTASPRTTTTELYYYYDDDTTTMAPLSSILPESPDVTSIGGLSTEATIGTSVPLDSTPESANTATTNMPVDEITNIMDTTTASPRTTTTELYYYYDDDTSTMAPPSSKPPVSSEVMSTVGFSTESTAGTGVPLDSTPDTMNLTTDIPVDEITKTTESVANVSSTKAVVDTFVTLLLTQSTTTKFVDVTEISAPPFSMLPVSTDVTSTVGLITESTAVTGFPFDSTTDEEFTITSTADMPSATTTTTVKISTTTSATVEDKTPATFETSSSSIAWTGESLVTDRTTILTTESGNTPVSNTTESSSPTTTTVKSSTSTSANVENKTSVDLVTTFMTPSTSTAINGDIVVIERTTIFATGSVNTPDSDTTESSVTKQQTDKSKDGQVAESVAVAEPEDTGAIVGGVIGGTLGAAAAAVGVVLMWKLGVFKRCAGKCGPRRSRVGHYDVEKAKSVPDVIMNGKSTSHPPTAEISNGILAT